MYNGLARVAFPEDADDLETASLADTWHGRVTQHDAAAAAAAAVIAPDARTSAPVSMTDYWKVGILASSLWCP
jgi:hypothetical protein